MPNMYTRGILFGEMTIELGETSTVTSEGTGMSCTVEFKTKVLSHIILFRTVHNHWTLVGLFLRHIQCNLRQGNP